MKGEIDVRGAKSTATYPYNRTFPRIEEIGQKNDAAVAIVDIEWYIKLFLGVHFADNLA